MNFKNTKTNAMKGIGKHSTFITFVCAAVGVGASIYFASKEIPKAKKEVKVILEREDLSKKEKTTEVVKTVGKNCWKTTVIALGTVLLVTGTSAITAANTAATVAGLTNTINIAEQKLKDYKEAVNECPNKKVSEEITNTVRQKTVNRATKDLTEEDYAKNEMCPDEYIWVDEYTGVKFKATYKQVMTAGKIIDLKIPNEGYQTLFDFYCELEEQGATFLNEKYPSMSESMGWTGAMDILTFVAMNDEGYTIHSIQYNELTTNF
jgi:hypothetical protein